MILIHDSTRPHNYSVHAGWIFRALDHSILQCLETISAYIQSIYILTWLFLTWLGSPAAASSWPPTTSLCKTTPSFRVKSNAYSSRDSTQPLGAWHFDEHYGFMRRIFLFDQSKKFLGFLFIFWTIIYLFSSFPLQKIKELLCSKRDWISSFHFYILVKKNYGRDHKVLTFYKKFSSI